MPRKALKTGLKFPNWENIFSQLDFSKKAVAKKYRPNWAFFLRLENFDKLSYTEIGRHAVFLVIFICFMSTGCFTVLPRQNG